MPRLYRNNIWAAAEVLKELKIKRVIEIHGRGTLDRMIEVVKFPYTENWKEKGNFVYKKTVYKNQQYDPVRYMLHHWGFLESNYDGYRYHYKVNLNKIPATQFIFEKLVQLNKDM